MNRAVNWGIHAAKLWKLPYKKRFLMASTANQGMLIWGRMYANDRMVICGKMYVNDRNGWMSFETLHVIDATLNGSTDMRLSSGERARLKIYET